MENICIFYFFGMVVIFDINSKKGKKNENWEFKLYECFLKYMFYFYVILCIRLWILNLRLYWFFKLGLEMDILFEVLVYNLV